MRRDAVREGRWKASPLVAAVVVVVAGDSGESQREWYIEEQTWQGGRLRVNMAVNLDENWVRQKMLSKVLNFKRFEGT